MNKVIYQQIHKRCGGAISVAGDKDFAILYCTKCNSTFSYESGLIIHNLWRNINKKDLKQDGDWRNKSNKELLKQLK